MEQNVERKKKMFVITIKFKLKSSLKKKRKKKEEEVILTSVKKKKRKEKRRIHFDLYTSRQFNFVDLRQSVKS